MTDDLILPRPAASKTNVARVPASRLSHDRRQEIVAVARALLIEKGYSAFTIDELAVRARCSKPTIYRRWRGKADLVMSLLGQPSAAPPIDSGALEKDLYLLLSRIAAGQREWGRLFLGVALEIQTDKEMALAWREHGFKFAASQFATIIDHAVARGELQTRPDMDLVHSLIPGTFIWHFATKAPSDPEVFVNNFLKRVLLPFLRAA